MATFLEPEEYIEQAYFFRHFRERLDLNFPAQEILECLVQLETFVVRLLPGDPDEALPQTNCRPHVAGAGRPVAVAARRLCTAAPSRPWRSPGSRS